MKNEKWILLLIFAVIGSIFIFTGYGYKNYANRSFNGLSKKTTYTAGRRIKYSNLNWYVVSDNGKYVTLILTANATVGAYGDTISWKDSDANDFLNEEWINDEDQIALKNEITHGAIVLDSEAKTYIRLIKYNEAKNLPIKNESMTPYWTMSSSDNKVWYVLEDGQLGYTDYDSETSSKHTCYKGTAETLKQISMYSDVLSIRNIKTVIEPYESTAIVGIDIENKTDICYKNYSVDNGKYIASGDEISYIAGYKKDKSVKQLGIRPVIIVKKK